MADPLAASFVSGISPSWDRKDLIDPLQQYGLPVMGLNVVTPWPKNTLLRVDPQTEALIVTPAYHAFRHFSYYIDPGAVRLDATETAFDVVAFANPDGSVAIVLHNRDNAPKQATLAVADRRPRFDIPALGWASLLLE